MIENTTRRTKLIATALVLAVAFLLGFVPQYQRARALQREADLDHERLASLQGKLKLADLRDLMGLVYLETSLKNYGVARQHSTEFFTKASQIVSGPGDPSVKAVLRDILPQRDLLTAGLAEGEPTIRTNIEEILSRLYGGTRLY